jgi:D-sedoheptulose 7-phosphate isomerase
MLLAEAPAGDMSLTSRSLELSSVIGSAEVTTADGARIEHELAIGQILQLLRELRRRDGSLYIVGNGGSAAVAAHSVTDFLNVAGLRASTLHDSSLLTCMANDYGYENAFARMLRTLARSTDALVAVSSSGKSPNIRNAAARMRDIGGGVITLSGFERDNALRAMGDYNVWLDSHDYGMVEIGHQFVLHNIADRLRLEEAK